MPGGRSDHPTLYTRFKSWLLADWNNWEEAHDVPPYDWAYDGELIEPAALPDLPPIDLNDLEPMFIHAHLIKASWKNVSLADGRTVMDRVYSFQGMALQSNEPITVLVGVPGMWLERLAQAVHEDFYTWRRAFSEQEERAYFEWLNLNPEKGENP